MINYLHFLPPLAELSPVSLMYILLSYTKIIPTRDEQGYFLYYLLNLFFTAKYTRALLQSG